MYVFYSISSINKTDRDEEVGTMAKTEATVEIMNDRSALARDKIIVRTSIIAIIVNIFLAGFKAVIGLAANSIAVILDAVNNLSDALSSVITIVGTKLAAKAPDKKHPLGYGRIEYLSAMIVSAIVLYAGITSAVESFKKIIHPEKAEYSVIALIIIAVAVVAKYFLGRYVKGQGKKANSGALEASGADAFFDAILSLSVFASAVIYIITGVSLEAYVGLVISVIIIKSGIEMMLDTVNDILGYRTDPKVVKKVKRIVAEEPEVMGAYDLLVNNYGPDKNYASIHVEVPDTMTADKIDELTRRLQEKVFVNTGIILTAVSVYSYNTSDNEAAKIRDNIRNIVTGFDWMMQMHGFYADTQNKKIRFDAVLSFDIDCKEGMKKLYEAVSEQYPEYELLIVPDVDLTDL